MCVSRRKITKIIGSSQNIFSNNTLAINMKQRLHVKQMRTYVDELSGPTFCTGDSPDRRGR